MNWNTITLQQFQDIHRLKDAGIDEVERIERLICILTGMSESQVDDMDLAKFNEIAKECGHFLSAESIPGKPVKSFRVGRNKYAINYKPTSLKHRQYVEILSFSEKPIENMHLIMASLVNQVKWGIRRDNKAEDHAIIASDMLNAPFLPVYHSCVFFCKIYRDLINHIQDYLIDQLTLKGMSRVEAKQVLIDSINAMDGFLAPSK